MSLVEQWNREHKERQARLMSRAVADRPIDLRRKPEVAPPVAAPVPVAKPAVVEIIEPKPAPVSYPCFRRAAVVIDLGSMRKIMGRPVAPVKVEPPKPNYPTIAQIKAVVSKWSGVSVLDIDSVRRTLDVTRPRQIAVYLSRNFTLKSLPAIGRAFGGRDHSTIHHAVRKISRLRKEDHGLDAALARLEAEISAAAQSATEE